jgi:hypothetical protein
VAHSRIDDLRRRVEADPASIAFAQLAEEYRRAGQTEEAVRVSREGLTRHPGYLSARVTLGRALLDLGQLDEARAELQFVASEAPENLAAVRGLAEIFHREGDAASALEYFQRALALARHDPELEEIVQQLSRQVGAEAGPSNGLSFEEAHQELLSAADRLPLVPPAASESAAAPPDDTAGSTAPFDFDTLVAALGTPAAPPLVEAVVRGETPEVFELPELPAAVGDPFAVLEAELRGQTPDESLATPSPSDPTPEAPQDDQDDGWLRRPYAADILAEPASTMSAPAVHDAVAAELEDMIADPVAPTADAEADTDTVAATVAVPESSVAPDAVSAAPADPAEPADVSEPTASAEGEPAVASIVDWLASPDPVAASPSEGPMAEVESPLPADAPPGAAAEASADIVEEPRVSETALDAPTDASPVVTATDDRGASSARRRDDDVLGDLEDWLHTLQDRSEP